MNYKEIEELAGHRPVSAWVIKLVNDAIAIEREACAVLCDRGDRMFKPALTQFDCAALIRARGQE
jgi:hypothetical protein